MAFLFIASFCYKICIKETSYQRARITSEQKRFAHFVQQGYFQKGLRRLGNLNKQKYLRLCSLMKCWQKYMRLTAPLNWSYKAFDINFWRASKWRLRNNTICRLCYFSISSKEAWVLSFPKLQNDELYYLLWNLHTKIP